MIRRSLLAAVALTVIGGVAAPAFADTASTTKGSDYVCVLGNNRTTGSSDGICVWFPNSALRNK
ncbi:MAG: hypothetical protein JWO22_293 [Frankiales bacterium]|nr:hypothetical protein [Frankiales bacterium]